MSRTEKVYSVLLVSVFLFFIISPLCLFLLLPFKKISESEKRYLAAFPKMEKSINSVLSFPKQFEKFYQDHFGLRDSLTKLNNLILLNLFQEAPSPFVLKGKNGWFFYIGEGVLNDYFGQKQAGAVYLEKYISIFSDRKYWLNSLGIHYLFVPVPNKITVYDEYLPKRIRQSRGLSFYEQFIKNINSNLISKNIINVYDLLNIDKKEQQVYLKTDTHWSHYGAYFTFNKIIRRCNLLFKKKYLKKIPDKELYREDAEFSGDISMIMHLEKYISEQASRLRIKNKCLGYRRVLQNNDLNLLPSRSATAGYTINKCYKEKITVLIISDSFGVFLQKFFNERFKKVYHFQNVQFNEAEKFILKKKPDVVIEVWVARNMRKIKADPALTAKVLQNQYNLSEKVVLSIDNLLDFKKIKNKNDLIFAIHKKQIVMQSSGDDPYFSVPFQPTAAEIGERYLVETEITAPEDTVFAMYFTTASAPNTFTEQQKVVAKIHKGTNRLLFRLPHPHVAGMIRIDPGITSGRYVLHSLTVKAVSEQTAADAAFQPENTH
jgi:hypothetical protein